MNHAGDALSGRRIVFVAIAVGVLALIAAALWAGHALTAPARSVGGVPPAALAARPLSFPSASGASLSAWFVQGEPGSGAVLLFHSVRASKASMLGRASFLKSLGFSLLLVDMQAHGQSEGERITFGHREARDVEAATVRLMQLAPGERIGVLGTSLGAAATTLSSTKMRYAAVVLESMYPTIEEAVADRLRLHLGPAGPWLAPVLLVQLGPWLGVRREDLRPIDRVGEFTSPVLVVHGAEDRHTTLAAARRVYDAIRAPNAMYVVEGAAHVDLHVYARAEYERRIGAFMIAHLRALRGSPVLLSSIQ